MNTISSNDTKIALAYNFYRNMANDPIPSVLDGKLLDLSGRPTKLLDDLAQGIINVAINIIAAKKVGKLDLVNLRNGDIKLESSTTKKNINHDVSISLLIVDPPKDKPINPVISNLLDIKRLDENGITQQEIFFTSAIDFILFYCARLVNKPSEKNKDKMDGFSMYFERNPQGQVYVHLFLNLS